MGDLNAIVSGNLLAFISLRSVLSGPVLSLPLTSELDIFGHFSEAN